MSGNWITLSDGRKVLVPFKKSKPSAAKKRKVLQVPHMKIASNTYKSEEGFTTPNATCPKCKASVYFYSHPNGARVFFDSLGPPWPLHPCTSAPIKTNLKLPKIRKWQKAGWKPIFIDKVILLESGKSVRVQASNQYHTLRFELGVDTLKKYNVSIKGLNDMLAHSIKNAQSSYTVELHDGRITLDARASLILTSFSDGNTRREIELEPKKITKFFVKENTTIQFSKLQKIEEFSIEEANKHWLFEFIYEGNSLSFECLKKAFKPGDTALDTFEIWCVLGKKALVVYVVNPITKTYLSRIISKKGIPKIIAYEDTLLPNQSTLTNLSLDTTISDDYWLLKGTIKDKLFCCVLDKGDSNFQLFVRTFEKESFVVTIEPIKRGQSWFGAYKLYMNNVLSGNVFNIPSYEDIRQ